ncbi:agmatinase family protein [Lentzea sp. NBRC 102530]|uniref:agmatinase family protein n=1 Tax=Lentzea sp. NBRC 102530 TaxID=3032201 RepID=UPI0024A2CE92|nr:agmatinase family protein [Lentzea sp. NBRC 102530]GLY47199.1 agmatinase [Lentzea sp. NBRC 102530]
MIDESWPHRIQPSINPQRTPGPIDLRRNFAQPAYSGIATFMGVPVCLTQEDLRAGEVDVAIMGVPLDQSVGHRGAAFGPRAIRSEERYLFNNYEDLVHASTRVHPFQQLRVVDYGDAAVDPFSHPNSMEPIKEMVTEIASVGATPILLGGDHTLLWPSVAALNEVHGPGSVAVVHFDAHPDCHAEVYGNTVSHTTPIYRLIEDEKIPGTNIVQCGLRAHSAPDDKQFNWMRRQGMKSHFMAEIERVGMNAVIDKLIADVSHVPNVYLSLDIDVLDPSHAPGTGTPEPAGLSTRELFPALRRLAHETNVIGMDVVEVAPNIDPGYSTALNARRAVFEVITGLAMRKMQISSTNYVNPIVSGQVKFPMK